MAIQAIPPARSTATTSATRFTELETTSSPSRRSLPSGDMARRAACQRLLPRATVLVATGAQSRERCLPCTIGRVTGIPAPWRRNDRLIGLALVVVSACGFGSGALFAKPVYAAGVDWLTLLFWRFLIAAALSWAWLLLIPGNRASLRLLTRRNALILLALGAIYVGNSGTYFAALETVPASLAALIVYLYPALVAVLSLRFVRRLRGRRAWLALAISTIGVAMAVGGIAPATAPPLLGIALTVASPVIYSVWIILAARLSGERGDREATGGGERNTAAPSSRRRTPRPWPRRRRRHRHRPRR